jgi:hypothetical protein
VPGNPNQRVRVEAVSGILMVVSGWLVKRGFLLLVRYTLVRIQKQSAGTVSGEDRLLGEGLLRSYNGQSSSTTRLMTCRL